MINVHDFAAGGQFLCFFATMTAAVVMLAYADRERRKRGVALKNAMYERDLRFMKGMAIEIFGRAVDIAAYLPVWPMLSAGNATAAANYATTAGPVALFAAVITVVGLIVIMWGWLAWLFKRWAIWAALGMTAFLYLVGVFGNAIIAWVYK